MSTLQRKINEYTPFLRFVFFAAGGRARDVLYRDGMNSERIMLSVLEHWTEDRLLGVPGIGPATVRKIREGLVELGFELKKGVAP